MSDLDKTGEVSVVSITPTPSLHSSRPTSRASNKSTTSNRSRRSSRKKLTTEGDADNGEEDTFNEVLFPKRDFPYKIGTVVEAKDVAHTWYKSRVVQLDLKDGMLLIHFDKWNNRYDEWFRADSPNLRAFQGALPKAGHELDKPLKIGHFVHAKYAGVKYVAKITDICEEADRITVVFDDGLQKALREKDLKRMAAQEYEKIPNKDDFGKELHLAVQYKNTLFDPNLPDKIKGKRKSSLRKSLGEVVRPQHLQRSISGDSTREDKWNESESRDVLSNKPESRDVLSNKPESRDVLSNKPDSRDVLSTKPETDLEELPLSILKAAPSNDKFKIADSKKSVQELDNRLTRKRKRNDFEDKNMKDMETDIPCCSKESLIQGSSLHKKFKTDIFQFDELYRTDDDCTSPFPEIKLSRLEDQIKTVTGEKIEGSLQFIKPKEDIEIDIERNTCDDVVDAETSGGGDNDDVVDAETAGGGDNDDVVDAETSGGGDNMIIIRDNSPPQIKINTNVAEIEVDEKSAPSQFKPAKEVTPGISGEVVDDIIIIVTDDEGEIEVKDDKPLFYTNSSDEDTIVDVGGKEPDIMPAPLTGVLHGIEIVQEDPSVIQMNKSDEELKSVVDKRKDAPQLPAKQVPKISDLPDTPVKDTPKPMEDVAASGPVKRGRGRPWGTLKFKALPSPPERMVTRKKQTTSKSNYGTASPVASVWKSPRNKSPRLNETEDDAPSSSKTGLPLKIPTKSPKTEKLEDSMQSESVDVAFLSEEALMQLDKPLADWFIGREAWLRLDPVNGLIFCAPCRAFATSLKDRKTKLVSGLARNSLVSIHTHEVSNQHRKKLVQWYKQYLKVPPPEYLFATKSPALDGNGPVLKKDFGCNFEGCKRSFRTEQLMLAHYRHTHAKPETPAQLCRKRDISLSSLAEVKEQDNKEVVDGTKDDQDDAMSDASVSTVSADMCDTDIVRCRCSDYEEDGFMLQCERCQTWQHGECLGIRQDTVPSYYICHICKNPPGIRESARHTERTMRELNEDGILPQFTRCVKRPAAVHSGGSSRTPLPMNHRAPIMAKTRKLMSFCVQILDRISSCERQLKLANLHCSQSKDASVIQLNELRRQKIRTEINRIADLIETQLDLLETHVEQNEREWGEISHLASNQTNLQSRQTLKQLSSDLEKVEKLCRLSRS